MTPPKLLKNTLLVALGVILGMVTALLVYALTINTPLEHVALATPVPPAESPAFTRLLSLHTRTELSEGHQVEILLDGGGTFPPMWDDIRSARRSVHIQLYYCQPGAIADSLGAVLVDRARAGVTVRFLYDAVGCELDRSYLDRLREGGVVVHAFRPVRWWALHRAQERSHVRIVIIDGVVGYTGGFGLDDRWSAAGDRGESGWRETNVRFTGPAVAQLQAAFADGWAESAGELLVETYHDAGTESVPSNSTTLGGSRTVTAGLAHSVPDVGSTTAERLLVLSIAGARRTLYIANAYFVPDDDFRRLLAAAVERGVDVRVLTPDEGTDVPVVRYAGRAHYEELLRAGVRIWEYRPAMMHAKTFVVDGVWSVIGSMNFDNRSLAVNDESSLLVADSALGARMDSIFLDDLDRAVELTLASFGERSAWERVKERFAVLASRLL